jgi:hypothetical protein
MIRFELPNPRRVIKDRIIPKENRAMGRNAEQQQLRERYVIALIEATFPLQKEAADPELTLELLIEAADLLKQHLLKELEERREESD